MSREARRMIPAHPILLECLAHLAWCDGQLRDEEDQFLLTVFHELGVNEVVQQTLLAELRPLPKDQDILVACPDVGTRREFLRLAVDLAWADGELSDPEWVVLKYFCQVFGLKKRTWTELRNWLNPSL